MARAAKPAHPAIAHFEDRFSAIGTAKRATKAKAYMKSALRFHGVANGEVRTETRAYCATHFPHGPLDHDALIATTSALFATDAFDLRTAGLFILERKVKYLVAADLPWLIELARSGACWAHVDHIVMELIGPILQREKTIAPRIRGWAKDDDFWIRRVALLSQLKPLSHEAGDFALFAEIAAPMIPETEFFIRKAIGWVLREVSKKRPALVRDFLRDHPACSGVTWREATKYLPAAMRRELELLREPRAAATARPKARRRP